MNPGIKAFFVHFFALVFFILASLAYFYPVLQGETIRQSDIEQYTGMAKEQNDYRDQTDLEPYWTNSAFGGMPTYQLGANYPHNYVKKLDRALRFLPRPADYLFLYFLGFYILLCCLKVDYRLAVIGALAFGFSTYLIIILGVGHNAKAHALGYIPMVLGGILLVFRKQYIWGFLLTAIAMALEIGANHYQMTYYFMLLVLVLGASYLIMAIRNKNLKHFFVSVGILMVAAILGIGANATGILATKEYADWSTRGQSEITINPDGSEKEVQDGLSKEYITQYSYGITESLDLFVPRLFGGSNSEDLGQKSKSFEFLTEQGLSRTKALEFSSSLPLYWGAQPGVAAPAYVGAVIWMLFLMGLMLYKGKLRWWLVAGSLMSLVLSWGKNFSWLTDLMIDYFPLYNKFRAVSSIQVILELCVPILAILGLVRLIRPSISEERKLKALKISALILGSICVLLFLFKGAFDFVGLNDSTYQKFFGDEIMAMIERDREAVFINDTIRSLIFVLLTGLVLWLLIKKKLKQNIAIIALGALIVVDLVGVDLRYVNKEDFVRKRRMEQPFQMLNADKQIGQDKSNYRVYDPGEGLNGARTSYFHKSIGGYHAAKPTAMQDLFEFHIYDNNLGVLNMLNVKYVLQRNEEGNMSVAINPNANGNAWFIEELIAVPDANSELMALDSLDLGTKAVVNTSKVSNLNRFEFQLDSTASIELINYQPNKLEYVAKNANAGIAVFSEMYYPEGWNAYINGEPVEHFKVNYALRAMRTPAGEQKIVFKFEPKVVETGSKISLVSTLLLGLCFIGGLGISFRAARKKV